MPKRRSKPLRLELEIPFSALVPDNRRFLRNGFVLTPRYRESKDAIFTLARGQTRGPYPIFPDEPLDVNLRFKLPDKRRRDCSNLLKGLFDSLEDICYADDKQIAKMCWDKDIDRDNPRVEITIVEVE
jgi:Holliday junction resolvase RusA-like endonuclease